MNSKSKPEGGEGAERHASLRMPELDRLTEAIIGAAIEVHRQLGPGLMESAYEACLCYELRRSEIGFERQVQLPILYKGVKLDCGYKMDLLVENAVVVELKTVERLLPVHSAQLLTYLKLSRKQVGLLLNFNEAVLKRGIKRLVNHYAATAGIAHSSAPSASEAVEQDRDPASEIPLNSRRLCASAVK